MEMRRRRSDESHAASAAAGVSAEGVGAGGSSGAADAAEGMHAASAGSDGAAGGCAAEASGAEREIEKVWGDCPDRTGNGRSGKSSEGCWKFEEWAFERERRFWKVSIPRYAKTTGITWSTPVGKHSILESQWWEWKEVWTWKGWSSGGSKWSSSVLRASECHVPPVHSRADCKCHGSTEHFLASANDEGARCGWWSIKTARFPSRTFAWFWSSSRSAASWDGMACTNGDDGWATWTST